MQKVSKLSLVAEMHFSLCLEFIFRVLIEQVPDIGLFFRIYFISN